MDDLRYELEHRYDGVVYHVYADNDLDALDTVGELAESRGDSFTVLRLFRVEGGVRTLAWDGSAGVPAPDPAPGGPEPVEVEGV